jgi:hypothetical protein
MICLLDNGDLTIAPANAELGDVVCILSGAVSPCLLRQHADGTWGLISGDCWLMVRDYQPIGCTAAFLCDEYVDDHPEDVVTFKIR